ncbi:hypothetical protein [Nocardioides immobilis]|uniref:hypothetical protein n=1 Tax=Nocardioides immobilis TaxID=2049295 RepID=UPI0011C486F3|nr:hypothetical protein [Nocardioides immobilis]
MAAAATACALLDAGFDTVILSRGSGARARQAAAVEALPAATTHLLGELGLQAELVSAGAVGVNGFENLHAQTPRVLDGTWVHVDRQRLAAECLLEARRRGARLAPAGARSAIDADAAAVVDATGRAARHSRPVGRDGAEVAAVYAGPGRGRARPGRVTRTPAGWAYRLDHPDLTTVGVVAATPAGRRLTPALAAELEIDASAFTQVATRPAGVQWSSRPVEGRRISVGDAALACSPIGGHGVRFGLVSAIAAGAVVNTWATGDYDTATAYYTDLVAAARRRHLTSLVALEDPEGGSAQAPEETPVLDVERHLVFAAEVHRRPANVGGLIVSREVCVLPDDALVRSAGGFDLLLLRDLLRGGATTREATAGLTASGVPEAAASQLLAWALRHSLIRYASPSGTAREVRTPGPN